MKVFSSLRILLIGTVLITSCKKDDPAEPSTGPTAATINLSGTQSDAITLTDHIADPNVPDYCVSGDWSVNNALTIEPGVTICMKANAKISINQNGSMKAIGTAALPITIKGEQPTAGYWSCIDFGFSNSTNNQLVYVKISDGAIDSNRPGMVYMGSDSQLNIDHCTFMRSLRYGLWVQTYSSNLTGLTNSTFVTCANTGFRIFAHNLNSIGSNNNVVGNGVDRIEVAGNPVTVPHTWKNAGVPYFVTGEIGVDAPVTVQPGAYFIMTASADINVSSTGSFNAIGTASQKIKFVGENNLAGSWGGFVFTAANSANNIMRHCEIAYGGNNASKDALLFLWLGSQLTLGNSEIHDSQSWGVKNLNGTQTFVDEGTNTYYNNASGNIGN